MTYRILNNDLFYESDVPNVFLHIEITTEQEVWRKAERLPLAECEQIAADPAAITAIADAFVARAIIARPGEKEAEAHAKSMELISLQARLAEAELNLQIEKNKNLPQ